MELKNGRDGIHIVLDSRGNTTGEAYVQFVSAEDTEKALKKNRDKIGHRWVVWDLTKLFFFFYSILKKSIFNSINIRNW